MDPPNPPRTSGLAEAAASFGRGADAYATHRPRYPVAVAEALGDLVADPGLAWEAGCGSGQLTLGLAAVFRRVVACDPSPRQLARAPRHPRVGYRCEAAEAGSLPDGVADLCVAAQAAHWFDLHRYAAEVRRVARPGGAVALVTYAPPRVTPEVDAVLRDVNETILGPYWSAARRHVEDGYASLPLPFDSLPTPDFELKERWDLEAFLAYVGTWSAVAAHRRGTGVDAVALMQSDLRAVWGPVERVREVAWTVRIQAGRVAAAEAREGRGTR